MRIQAAVLERPDGALTSHRVRIETAELDGPRDEEVLVRVTSCGVCGTDRGCLHGQEPYPTPGVLGHEGAGIVEAVGRNVTLVKPGDRVVMGFPFCGVCRNCRAGQPRYCEHGKELMFGGYRLDGSTPLRRGDGEPLAGRFFQQSSWATHAVALERQLAKVPDHIDHDLMGPLGCSITTGAGAVLNELRPTPGSSIAVFGAGSVGLSAVMAARLTGATTIIAIDKDERRLALALELGATHVIHGTGDLDAQVKELSGGGVDRAVEATNGANLVAEACKSLAMLGVCAMVGGAKPTAEISLNHPDMLLNGKRLIGVMGGGGQTPAFHLSLMELQAQGRFPLEKLVRFYDFADINQAIEDSDSGAVVKPILRMR
ncbi:NAD(P)-dependent alcohol dehydrogenase [Azospirillum sp. SYSU D00513]|uniref:NAD(P)-dependent alcohol dehydrogenase n=1 Tax=Azospirillum sp. SYSU D00513 TaxID=2812561 RepID=UPI001A96D85A|nr:NAD(P)-dependent alcohol dehydrogenase [Azospirillum sp. SYSU D00513]